MLKSSPQKIKAGTSFEAPAKRKSGEYFPTGNIAALFLSSIADVGTNHRFLVSGSYMVFYRVQGSNVYVDRILYGRSDYMSVLFKDLLRKETIE